MLSPGDCALPRPRRVAPAICWRPLIVVICALASAAAVAWLYLLALHGGFWRTGYRLPPGGQQLPALPSVVAVIPARNEADMVPACLPSLLEQDYPGRFSVVVVDDDSNDGTAEEAGAAGKAAGWRVVRGRTGTAAAHPLIPPGDRTLIVAAARPAPEGWAGKVWAMSEGLAAAGSLPQYVLFTDADIAYAPGTVTALASAAAGGGFALVSQMARLRTATRWERVLVPAFVYFFAQLYPFRRVADPRSRTAAAAGGCMLVQTDVLATAGGLAQIRDARIDDVALGRAIKRSGARCWLGLSTDVVSRRPYGRLTDIWDMVARSAYTQLRYSPAALAGTLVSLSWLYLLPPLAGIAGLAALAAGANAGLSAWLAAGGLAGWVMMTITYVPMLRLYGLSALRATTLPLVAGLYAAMTADSARRHRAGRGGAWKGRVIQLATEPDTGAGDSAPEHQEKLLASSGGRLARQTKSSSQVRRSRRGATTIHLV
jgi:hopene-associated glycosyltransferase HpnB